MSFQLKEIVTLILLLNWAQDSQTRDGLLGMENGDPSPSANIAAKSFLSKMPRVQLIPFCLVSSTHFSCSSSGWNLPRKGNARGKPIPLAVFLAPQNPRDRLSWGCFNLATQADVPTFPTLVRGPSSPCPRSITPPSPRGVWELPSVGSTEKCIVLWLQRCLSLPTKSCGTSLRSWDLRRQELSGLFVLPFGFWSL